MPDYLKCPYRTDTTITLKDGTRVEGAICQLTTKFLLGQEQGYCGSICKECSEGPNPQSLKSPTLIDLMKRSCRRAFSVDTSSVGTTSPKIRAEFLKKLKALDELQPELEQLLLIAATMGVISEPKEADTLFEEIHRENVGLDETPSV